MPLAPGGDLPKKPPRKKESKLEKCDLGIDTGISDGLAAGTALVGAGALLAGATSSEARGGMGSAAGAVGSALLSFAKQLPWVAPIAFVVAGVAQAAADVHTLKRDAQIFAANVRSAENIMMQVAKKGKLGAVQETCEMLKFEMEEGLAFCHKLKTKYFVSQMLTSGRDCDKFKDISDSIQRQITVIAAAASVETHDIITDEFEQGQALKDKIAELGGAAAVAADPELKAQCAEFMKASDELIVSAVDEVARAVKLEAEKSQKKMDDMMEQSRAQTKVLEDQVANLTKMMEVLLQQRLGGAGVDASKDDGKKEEAPAPVEEKAPAAPVDAAAAGVDASKDDGEKEEAPAPVEETAPAAPVDAAAAGVDASKDDGEKEEAPAPVEETAPAAPVDAAAETVADASDASDASDATPAPERETTSEVPVPVDAPVDDPDAIARKISETVDTQISGAVVRDLMSRMPVADTEAERIEVVQKYGLSNDDITDLIGDESLKEITDMAIETFGVHDSYVGTIDATRQTMVAFSTRRDDAGTGNGDDGDAPPPPNIAGMWAPNIMTSCKHVVKKNDLLQSNGSFATEMEHMPNLTMADYAALAEAGHDECGRFLPAIGAVMADAEGAVPDETLVPSDHNPHGDKGMTYGAVRAFLQTMGSDADAHYSGAPIQIEGQTVATFCVLDTKRRDDVDPSAMRAFAKKAEAVLVDRARRRGVALDADE